MEPNKCIALIHFNYLANSQNQPITLQSPLLLLSSSSSQSQSSSYNKSTIIIVKAFISFHYNHWDLTATTPFSTILEQKYQYFFCCSLLAFENYSHLHETKQKKSLSSIIISFNIKSRKQRRTVTKEGNLFGDRDYVHFS